MTILHENALLIKVTVHRFFFRKIDRRVSREIARTHGVDEAMGRYIKDIIPKEYIAPLQSCLNEVVPFVYLHTHPWFDGGWRLLPVSFYSKVQEKIRAINQEAESLVHQLIPELPNIHVEAKKRLGSLYDPSDYPSPEEIEAKFRVDVFYNPIPTTDDFRCKISEEDLKEIKKNAEEASQQILQSAMESLRERIISILERIIERMSTETYKNKKGKEIHPRLFGSILDNMTELVQLLPDLNILNDPQIEETRRKMEEEFADLSIEALREDENLRKEVAEKAGSILDNLSGVI